MFEDERTEAPTPRRRRRAREMGHVARSPELVASLVLLLGLLSLLISGRWAVGMLCEAVRVCLEGASKGEGMRALTWAAKVGLLSSAPVMAVTLTGAIAGNLAQVGVLFTTQPLSPRLQNISPVEGLKRIFSRRMMAHLLKGVAKFGVAIGVFSLVLWGAVEEIAVGLLSDPARALAASTQVLVKVACWVVGALVVLGVLDFALVWRAYERSLWMTRRELMQELRETEIHPLVRHRLIRHRRQVLSGGIREVRKASVVLTNPLEVAVALRYEPLTMRAPKVVAKGMGILARRIKMEAEKAGVPVVTNPPLAWALYRGVPLGAEIPPKLYKAVAEVLAYVYRVLGRAPWR